MNAPRPISDSELLQACRDASGPRQEQALTLLFQRHKPAATGMLVRKGVPPNLAPDLLAGALTKLWLSIAAAEKTPTIRNVAAWLARTAWNLHIDEIRSATRRAIDELSSDIPSDIPDPGQQLLLDERNRRMGDAMARLAEQKPTFARALELWLDGADHNEIGLELAMTPLSVRQTLLRARRQLARLLDAG